MNVDRLICDRSRALDCSGIRRVFELGARLSNPVNLSIGQPEFPVPEAIKRAAADAIARDANGYTLSQGIPELRDRIARHLRRDVGWECEPAQGSGAPGSRPRVMVTSGTSGALLLVALAILAPGDEIIVPDPYFVLYPALPTLCGARAVLCDTYPDFRLTAARVEPLLSPRTKAVLLNSPSNPCGVVATQRECDDLLDLCRRRGVLLISDEIYDRFVYTDAAPGGAPPPCPSPARAPGASDDVLLIRGFGKTYGPTGWRLGYAAGPARLIDEMTKLQQYTFVCPPTPLQWGGIAALDVDMSAQVNAYRRRRDRVVERLRAVTEIAEPGGAFYAFPRVPERLGVSASAFIERCVGRGLLVIPGGVFSTRDTHLRLSFAALDETVERGLDILIDLMRGG